MIFLKYMINNKITYTICLLLTFSSFADDGLVLTNTRLENKELFQKVLTEHIKNSYEAENKTDMEKIKERLDVCNPKKNLNSPRSYSGTYKVCMDLYVFDIAAGSGIFTIKNTDLQGRSQKLNGNAPFVGGQIILPNKLGQNFILEGKYWFFPNFSSNKSALESLRTSSVFESMILHHRRIKATNWSFRLGAVGYKVPTVKNLNTSAFSLQADIELRNVLLCGLLFGLKYVPDRANGMRHMLYADLISLAYTDNRILKHLSTSLMLRGGYKWFVSKRVALAADMTLFNYHTKYEEKVASTLWGAGMQLFLF